MHLGQQLKKLLVLCILLLKSTNAFSELCAEQPLGVMAGQPFFGLPLIDSELTNRPTVTPHEVAQAYHILLGREPDSSGFHGWANGHLTCQQVVHEISHSREAKARIAEFYRLYLGREGSAEEINGWADSLAFDGIARVEAKIAGSPEARQRPPIFSQVVQPLEGLNECQYALRACQTSCTNPLCLQVCDHSIRTHLNCP